MCAHCMHCCYLMLFTFFFFNDTATTEIYTLSLHDALPIFTKRLTSRIANFVRSRFTKDYVRDTGCTLKAMRRECREALVPFKGMHRFIPALIRGAGYRLVEVPVNHRPRRFGQTKYGFGSRALRATIDMFGVRWLLSRRLNYKIGDS